ncbi:MAG: epoxide hydrolase [Candidatus Hydrogenedentota bacterium]|nr:MAG: epoxide hydrolase [Candidatus Hydrogenedentota bacterium]
MYTVPALAQEKSTVQKPELRFIESNGIRMRIAEMGEGPLVLLIHGWPESWYSWRHQMPALAEAGYHVVAPDMRGYGKTDAPQDVESYDIHHLTADVVGIIDALGEKTAIIIGHDWGSIVSWNCMLLHPDRFSALVAMSVPYGGRAPSSPLESWKKQSGDNFFYILYHQEPGVAEAEYDADPRGILSRLYLSPDSPREDPEVTDPKRSAGGWIPRLGASKGLPDWLSQEELDFFVDEFTEAGFRGGINYYRNFKRNWETTPQLTDAKISQPVLFIAGEKDIVISGATAPMLTDLLSHTAEDLRGVKLIPEVGHWVQQEAPEETNKAILEFLGTLDKS